MQGIKIIRNRNIVFNESEMPCLRNKIDRPKVHTNKNNSQSEVKLARLCHAQAKNNKTGAHQLDENVGSIDKYKVN